MRPGWVDLIRKLVDEAEYYNRYAELFAGEMTEKWCRGKEDMSLQILSFVLGKKADSMVKSELLAAAANELRILSSIPEDSGPDIGPEMLSASLNTQPSPPVAHGLRPVRHRSGRMDRPTTRRFLCPCITRLT